MSKEDQQILVVERDVLFNGNSFEGFRSHSELDYEYRILSNIQPMRRGDAEEDIMYKQPIGYMMIVNPAEKKVFAYRRASDGNYNEKRLRGKWSWGVGGHIESHELVHENPIRESMGREVEEEVRIQGNVLDMKILGYINSESNEVSKVHFGVLYLMEVDGEVLPGDSEMIEGRFVSIGELEAMCSSEDFVVEEWSKISLEPLKKYFGFN